MSRFNKWHIPIGTQVLVKDDRGKHVVGSIVSYGHGPDDPSRFAYFVQVRQVGECTSTLRTYWRARVRRA